MKGSVILVVSTSLEECLASSITHNAHTPALRPTGLQILSNSISNFLSVKFCNTREHFFMVHHSEAEDCL